MSGPKAAILAIGTELTSGAVNESNSVILSAWLADRGIEVALVQKLPDDIDAVAAQTRRMIADVDIIIVTGGLGPTHDDITREALAQATQRPLERDKEASAAISKLMPAGSDEEYFMKQALMPRGAEPIILATGTAPGIIIDDTDYILFSLPGVRREMESMLDSVSASLRRRFGHLTEFTRTVLRLSGAPEPVIAKAIRPIIEEHREIEFTILASPGEISLTITAALARDDELRDFNGAVADLKRALRPFLLGLDNETLPQTVGRLLKERDLTLSVAESITGGQVGAMITEPGGASAFFLGGIVCYSDMAKERLLAVPAEIIAERGAVSPECAIAMAEGARDALGSDLAISTTGIAGPTGARAGKPIGLCYLGISSASASKVEKLELSGSRLSVQKKASIASLRAIIKTLLEE